MQFQKSTGSEYVLATPDEKAQYSSMEIYQKISEDTPMSSYQSKNSTILDNSSSESQLNNKRSLGKLLTASENLLSRATVVSKENQFLPTTCKSYRAPTPEFVSAKSGAKSANIQKLNQHSININNTILKPTNYSKPTSSRVIATSSLRSKSTENLSEKFQKSYTRHNKDVDGVPKYTGKKHTIPNLNPDKRPDYRNNITPDMARNKYKNTKHENGNISINSNGTNVRELSGNTQSLSRQQNRSNPLKSMEIAATPPQLKIPPAQPKKYNKRIPHAVKEQRSQSSLSAKYSQHNSQNTKMNRSRQGFIKGSQETAATPESSNKLLKSDSKPKETPLLASKDIALRRTSQKFIKSSSIKTPSISNVSAIVQKLQKSQNEQSMSHNDPNLYSASSNKSSYKLPPVSGRLLELSKSRPRRLIESIKQREEIAKKEELRAQSIYGNALRKSNNNNKKSPTNNFNKVEGSTDDFDLLVEEGQLPQPENSSAFISKDEHQNNVLAPHHHHYQQFNNKVDLPSNSSDGKEENNKDAEEKDDTNSKEGKSSIDEGYLGIDISLVQKASEIVIENAQIDADEVLDVKGQPRISAEPQILDEKYSTDQRDNQLPLPKPRLDTLEKENSRFENNLVSRSTQREKVACFDDYNASMPSLQIHSNPNPVNSLNFSCASLPNAPQNDANANASEDADGKLTTSRGENRFKTPAHTNNRYNTENSTDKKFNTLSGPTMTEFTQKRNNLYSLNANNQEPTSLHKKYNTLKSAKLKLDALKINKIFSSKYDLEQHSCENDEFIIVTSPTSETRKAQRSIVNLNFTPRIERTIKSLTGSFNSNKEASIDDSDKKLFNAGLESSQYYKTGDRNSMTFFDTDTDVSIEKSSLTLSIDKNDPNINSDNSFYHVTNSCSYESLLLNKANDITFDQSNDQFEETNKYKSYERNKQRSKRDSRDKYKMMLSFATKSFDQSLNTNLKKGSNEGPDNKEIAKIYNPVSTPNLENSIPKFHTISSHADVENHLASLISESRDYLDTANESIKKIIALHKHDYTNERKNVVMEISESESSYLSDLYLLREVYFDCDTLPNTYRNIGFSETDKKIIFGNLNQVIQITEKLVFLLLQSIVNEISEKPNSLRFYHVYDFLADQIEKTYSVYCSNFETALTRLSDIIDITSPGSFGHKSSSASASNLQNAHVVSFDKKLLKDLPKSLNRRKAMKNSKKLKSTTSSISEYTEPYLPPNLSYSRSVLDFLNIQQKKLAGRTLSWDLRSLLIKPVQRVLKYHLLLTRLSELSPNEPAKFYGLTASRYVLLAEKVNKANPKNELSDSSLANTQLSAKNGSLESNENPLIELVSRVGNSNSKSKHLFKTSSSTEDAAHDNSDLSGLVNRLLDWIDYLNLILKTIHGWEDTFRELLFQTNVQAVALSSFFTGKSAVEVENTGNEQLTGLELLSKKPYDHLETSRTLEDPTLSNYEDNTIAGINERYSNGYVQSINAILQAVFSSTVHQSLKRKAYIPLLQLIKICMSLRKFAKIVLLASKPNIPQEDKVIILSTYSLSLENAMEMLEREIPQLLELQASAVEIIITNIKHIQIQFYSQAIDMLSEKMRQLSSNNSYTNKCDLSLSKYTGFSKSKYPLNSYKANQNGNWVENITMDYLERCKVSEYNFLAIKSPSTSSNSGSTRDSYYKSFKNYEEFKFPSSNDSNLYLKEISKIFANTNANFRPSLYADPYIISLNKMASNIEIKPGFLSGKSSSLASKLARVTNLFPGVNKKKSSSKLNLLKKSSSISRKSSSFLSTITNDVEKTRSRMSSRASLIINSTPTSLDQSDRASIADSKIIIKDFFKLPVLDLAEFTSMSMAEGGEHSPPNTKNAGGSDFIENRHSNYNAFGLPSVNYGMNASNPKNSYIGEMSTAFLRGSHPSKMAEHTSNLSHSSSVYSPKFSENSNHIQPALTHSKSVLSLGAIERTSFSSPFPLEAKDLNLYNNSSKLLNYSNYSNDAPKISHSKLISISKKLSENSESPLTTTPK